MLLQSTLMAVVGDTHGHLQLALCVLARWQSELQVKFEAVFLCGDVGTFTADSQLDSATRRHAKANPCELEFLHQWSTTPQSPWLDFIFKPEDYGGLGLTCPVVMVHGNHEGFPHLERLVPSEIPKRPVRMEDLPAVDTNGHIRLLPSGWQTASPSGHLVAGVGGIEKGQRYARYHPMAYVDEEAVLQLLEGGKVSILLTHQGPSGIQGEHGSEVLHLLLDAGVARAWFHGHSTPITKMVRAGPAGNCQVVPLGDIAFPGRGPDSDKPGEHGWALVNIGSGDLTVSKQVPPFLRDFRRTKWSHTDEGLLICPSLRSVAWSLRTKYQMSQYRRVKQ